MVNKYNRQRQKVTEGIIGAVISVRLIDKKASALKIRDTIINNPKVYGITADLMPKKRTIEKILHEHEDSLRKVLNSNIDRPWCVGASKKYDISPEAVAIMLTVQKLVSPDSVVLRNLTIRVGQWLSRLYLALAPLAKSKYPDSQKAQCGVFITVAMQYAEMERIAEVTGKDYPNTSVLDKLYFTGGDADINEGFFFAFNCPGLLADYQDFKKKGAK